jgi:hypothetical protein
MFFGFVSFRDKCIFSARVRWLDTGEELMDGYNCGVCGSYVLALAELDSGEKVVGKDVQPRVGMKVIGALNSGYENMGVGVITAIVEKNGTSCNVTWDNSGPGQKYGYCTGFRGRFHLAMVEEEDAPDELVSEEIQEDDVTPELQVDLSPFILVGKDVNARTGMRVHPVIHGIKQNDLGTLVALREGGKVCDVRWDQSKSVQTGISTGLMDEFHLALSDEELSGIVIGRDVKPAVGQRVRPLTFKNTAGVEGTFMDCSGSERGQITQLLPDGDVVVRWQTSPNEKPRGGIFQTGRHSAYFLALDEGVSFFLDSRAGRPSGRRPKTGRSSCPPSRAAALRKLPSAGGGDDAGQSRERITGGRGGRALVCGKDVAPHVGQVVFALAGGGRADMGAGRISHVDAGGLAVRVRWGGGEETQALTGRFGEFDLGTLPEDPEGPAGPGDGLGGRIL